MMEYQPGHGLPEHQDQRFLCLPPTTTVSISIPIELLPFLSLLARMADDADLWWSADDHENAIKVMGLLENELGGL